jgi:hypothetical protein
VTRSRRPNRLRLLWRPKPIHPGGGQHIRAGRLHLRTPQRQESLHGAHGRTRSPGFVSDPVPLSRSGHCLRGGHRRCPHFAGGEPISLWRLLRKSQLKRVVCVCDCHADCWLTGQRSVTRDVWRESCICPGAAPVREAEQHREERGREVAGVLAEARRAGERDPEQIQSRLREAFQAHGEAPPPGLATTSRMAVAATAPRGTRSVRLLWLGARAVAGTIRWAWTPGPDSARDASNAAQTRAMYRVIGAMAGVGALLTVAAVRSSGWRRLPLAVGAVLGWLATSWTMALGSAVAGMARAAEGGQSTSERADTDV